MFEDKTTETLMNAMLDRIPSTLDKREGSIIYDALAPAAAELANAYVDLDRMIDQLYADTAEGEYLERRAAERGITRNGAISAVITASFNIPIPMGTRFYCGALSYITLDQMPSESGYTYQLQCETSGAVGNLREGDLVPVEYIQGLTTAKITSLYTVGEDTEDDESLRQRYMDMTEAQAFGGNIADYQQRVGMIPGVGAVKVTPRANTDDHIIITIMASDGSIPSSVFVEQVQNAVDPVDNAGNGYGLAPIGHTPIVHAAEAVNITIDMQMEYYDGYTWDMVQNAVRDKIDSYFVRLLDNWENTSSIIIRRSQIEAAVLDVDGILDVVTIKLNGASSNLTLSGFAVPVLGAITAHE